MSKAEELAKWCDVMAAPPHSASKKQKFLSISAHLRALDASHQRLVEALERCRFGSLNVSLDDLVFCSAAIKQAKELS